jgi:hypothetical protein
MDWHLNMSPWRDTARIVIFDSVLTAIGLLLFS